MYTELLKKLAVVFAITGITACNLTVEIRNDAGDEAGGRVTSIDGQIDCPSKCSHDYKSTNDMVTLDAIAEPGHLFVDFRDPGVCKNDEVSRLAGRCEFKMDLNRKIVAIFAPDEDICPSDPEDNCLENPVGDFDGDGLNNEDEANGCESDPWAKCEEMVTTLGEVFEIFDEVLEDDTVADTDNPWYETLKQGEGTSTAVCDVVKWHVTEWNKSLPPKDDEDYAHLCNNEVTIVSPVQGKHYKVLPAEFVVQYEFEPREFFLNGHDVTEYFSLGESEASANRNSLMEYVREGNNYFQVNSPDGPAISFVSDTLAPQVVAFKRGGTIEGYLVDSSQVTSLRINNKTASVKSDLTFTASVPSTNIYDFTATDELGNSQSVKISDKNMLHKNSVKTVVANSGIQFVRDEAIPILNAMDLKPLVSGEKILSSTVKCIISSRGRRGVEVVMEDLKMRVNNLDLNVTNDGINFEIDVSDIVLSVYAVTRNCLIPDVGVHPNLEISSLNISGTVNLMLENGKPVLDSRRGNVRIGTVTYQRIPDWVEKMFLLYSITNLIADALDNTIGDITLNKFEDVFSTQFDKLIPKDFVIDVLDKKIKIDYQLEDLGVSSQGIAVAVSSRISSLNPSSNIRSPLGSIYTPQAVPSVNPNGSDVGIGVSANVINQTLAAAYESGLTNLVLILKGNVGGNSSNDVIDNVEVHFGQSNAGLGNDGDISVRVGPQSPPYVTFQQSKPFKVGAQGLELIVESKKNGKWENFFSTVINASSDIKVGVNDDATLDIELVSQPEFTIVDLTVKDESLDPLFVDFIVTSILPTILDVIPNAVEGIKIPVVFGYTFDVNRIKNIGSGGAHIGIEGDLVKAAQ